MKVILADIHGSFLRHELLVGVTIEGHGSLHLQNVNSLLILLNIGFKLLYQSTAIGLIQLIDVSSVVGYQLAGRSVLTFRLLSSFPARASISVVFPELGGPRSRVILQRHQFSQRWHLLTPTNAKQSVIIVHSTYGVSCSGLPAGFDDAADVVQNRDYFLLRGCKMKDVQNPLFPTEFNLSNFILIQNQIFLVTVRFS